MNKTEEQFYELAAREIANKQFVPGLMSKAFSDSNGDEKATFATYIRLRVSQLEDQLLQNQNQEQQKQQNEIKRRDALNPPSIPRRLGRFSMSHPLLFWTIILGIIIDFIYAIR